MRPGARTVSAKRPVIDKLYAKYGSRVDFVGVSGSDTAMDGTSASSENDVLNWIGRFNVRYPVAYDPILNVANLYLQGGFPTFAIIDTRKQIRYLNDGEISYGELDSALRTPCFANPPRGTRSSAAGRPAFRSRARSAGASAAESRADRRRTSRR